MNYFGSKKLKNLTYKIKNQNKPNNILKRQERDTECIS